MTSSKPPSSHTIAANAKIKRSLKFADRQAFEDSQRGFIAKLDQPKIMPSGGAGNPVFDTTNMEFLNGEAPETVNPSLWRNAQLNVLYHGLFEVVPGKLYQVRNYDMACMTLIAGNTGWVVIDPLTAVETSRAALELANKQLGRREVRAVVITHSHVDHFGGVEGVVSLDQVMSGSVPLVAPMDFTKESLNEFVLLGIPMKRRATYMYGSDLPRNERGYVGSGLGPQLAIGTMSFISPSDIIRQTGEKRTLDGIEFHFQMTMGSEAPSEMCFYFPQFKALCMSEIVTHHLHNLYTIRGAQIRDASAWASQIEEAIDLFCGEGQIEVEFASHHWPTWGRERIRKLMEGQVDLYKYIHDQTVRLANHGFNKEEIAEQLELPEALANNFSNRGYYGTLHHNARAVYVKYLGYLDGNPAHIHPLGPVESAKKYVEFMGGPANIIARARKCFEAGEYRWVAEVLNHIVQADESNEEAKLLLADTFEQMAYQAESAQWRNFYLTGAHELRHGKPNMPVRLPGIAFGVSAHASVEEFFKLTSIRVNGIKAAQFSLRMLVCFEDKEHKHLLLLRNGVLHSSQVDAGDHGAALKLIFDTTQSLKNLLLSLDATETFKEMVEDGTVKHDGDIQQMFNLLGVLEYFDIQFPMVTPRSRL